MSLREDLPARANFQPVKPQQAVAGVLQPRVNLSRFKRSIAGPKVSVEQFCDLLRRARSFALVQGSTNLLVEGSIRIWNLAHSLYSIWRAKLLRCSSSFSYRVIKNKRLRGAASHEMENQSANYSCIAVPQQYSLKYASVQIHWMPLILLRRNFQETESSSQGSSHNSANNPQSRPQLWSLLGMEVRSGH